MPHGKQKHQFSAEPQKGLKVPSPLKEEFNMSRQAYFSQGLLAPFFSQEYYCSTFADRKIKAQKGELTWIKTDL